MGRDLSDAVVAVVGASGALGSRVARVLDEHGARLILVGREEQRLRDSGVRGEVVVGDVTDAGLGGRVVETAHRAHGRLDGVVNATGVVAFGPLADTDDAVLEQLFLVNVVGPLWLLRRVQPALADSRGFVVNLSGVVAEQPLPGMVAYSASKAALAAADEALVRELRRAGISVHDLRPPHTETGLAERPLAGTAPRMPTGLDPDRVARRIVQAVVDGEAVVHPDGF